MNIRGFSVTVNDVKWPKLTLIITPNNVTEQGLQRDVPYDSALQEFEPLVRDYLNQIVNQLTERHK